MNHIIVILTKAIANTIKKLIFKASCKGGKLETSLKKGDNESYNINGEDVRDPHRINYIGSDRTVKSIMPTNSWSLLGRQFYSSDFFTDDVKKEFEQCMNSAKSQLEKSHKFQGFMKSIQEKLSNQINRPDIKSEFTMYDTTHFLKTLEFYVEKNGKKINLISEGSGIQNSFILATLQTLSEIDFRKNSKQSNNPIFIDEPELYLHPHAKKSLYNTFKKLSDSGTQIFYITHSAEFLSYENSEQIHKFYVDGENGTKNKKGSTSDGLTPRQQMIEPDKISFNNAFFADTVFLVEGYTDEIFLRYILQNKNPNRTIEDFNISVVNCSSKDNIVRFHNLYKALGIACYVLYDKDSTLPTDDKKGAEYTKDVIMSQQKQRDDNNAELIKCNGYGFEENLEHFLTGNLEYHLDNDKKRDIVQRWIDSLSASQKQPKIDEIWKELINKISILNDYENNKSN